jgi:hypothetical protein
MLCTWTTGKAGKGALVGGREGKGVGGGYPGNTYVMLSVLPKSAVSRDEKHVLENLYRTV